MITYPSTYAPSISKRTISTVKTYDEEGRLITEETVEEIEYAPTLSTLPNQPWILTNTSDNTAHYNHTHQALPLDLDPPGQVE